MIDEDYIPEDETNEELNDTQADTGFDAIVSSGGNHFYENDENAEDGEENNEGEEDGEGNENEEEKEDDEDKEENEDGHVRA